MTDNEIRFAIVDACPDLFRLMYREDGSPFLVQKTDWINQVVDPINDLNWMHEVVVSQKWQHQQQLAFIAYLAHKKSDFGLVNASARERAEAFLRTIGKWISTQ